jgi:hypothetical protein
MSSRTGWRPSATCCSLLGAYSLRLRTRFASPPRCPALAPGTLQVDVLPDSITIEGKVKGSERRLLHQFALPARIDPDQVEAIVDAGVLSIVARKTAIRGTTNARHAA